jgi:hypothetical protein
MKSPIPQHLGVMVMHLTIRATFVWIGLFILAFVNGALREIGIKKFLGLGEPIAHQLSCLTGLILWTSFVWSLWQWLKIKSFSEAGSVGLGWFVATAFTEIFLINKFMGKMDWNEIAQTYNVARGELWPLVLIWLGLLPISMFWIRNVRRQS